MKLNSVSSVLDSLNFSNMVLLAISGDIRRNLLI